jgi:hypothetical protein
MWLWSFGVWSVGTSAPPHGTLENTSRRDDNKFPAAGAFLHIGGGMDDGFIIV